jgi:hypothetical protein
LNVFTKASAIRQELVDTAIGMAVCDAGDHVGQIGLLIDAVEFASLDERSDDGPMLAAAVRTREECILSIQCNRTNRSLDHIAVNLDATVVNEADQACPARQSIADRFGKLRLLADELKLGVQPSSQIVDERPGLLLTKVAPLLGGPAADRALDGIELGNPLQCLARNRCRAGDSQFAEAPPDMRPAEGEFDVTALGERPVAGVAVDLKDASKPNQVRTRPFGLAIRGVDIGDARWIDPAPRSVVAGIGSELTGFGSPAAGIKHGRRRLVANSLPDPFSTANRRS